MNKILILALVCILNTFSFAATEFDKDIVVKNQTRNDKVKTVFKEMMNAYEEEDITEFLSYVSEDRFYQDYMTFMEAIEEDIRVYDILSIDTWVNSIVDDGVKRYLYVQWEKRYEDSNADTQITKKGYSRFLFDDINGKYKLIELAGNNFWGGSFSEWTAQVSRIGGQEDEKLPDLIIVSARRFPANFAAVPPTPARTQIDIKNQGDTETTTTVKVTNNDTGFFAEYTNNISVGTTITITITPDNGNAVGDTIVVDPDNTIAETDETNNEILSH